MYVLYVSPDICMHMFVYVWQSLYMYQKFSNICKSEYNITSMILKVYAVDKVIKTF